MAKSPVLPFCQKIFLHTQSTHLTRGTALKMGDINNRLNHFCVSFSVTGGRDIAPYSAVRCNGENTLLITIYLGRYLCTHRELFALE